MEQLIHNIYYLCGNFATIEDFKTTFVLWTVVCILNLRINLGTDIQADTKDKINCRL